MVFKASVVTTALHEVVISQGICGSLMTNLFCAET
jgi:hypothetical protein